jgi:hypothetical protein
MPKYVASRTLTATAWNATLLGPDPSNAIARLKDQPGKDLIKYGTSRCDDTLVRDGLVDEFVSGSGLSWPAQANGCSTTLTPQASTSGSPMRGGWRTGP